MKTKIRAKYILTYQEGRLTMLEDACVVYEEDTIIYVGKDDGGHVDEVMDETENLLLPGFIDLDALGDVDHSLIFMGFPQERREDLAWSREL